MDKLTPPPRLSPLDLKARRDRGDDFILLDVREAWEFALANLGGKHIPMSDLAERLGEIDNGKEIVVLCHHGVRSARVAAYLRQNGFPNATDVSGGIDLWARAVDPKTPRY